MAIEEKGQEDQIKAVSFAAGTAACLACIQRAIVVSVFVHWQMWAFLALNLLLLAILFTSKSQNNPTDTENGGYSDFKNKEKKKTKEQCELGVLTNGSVDKSEQEPKNDEDDEKKEDYDDLSKEELNQRVEAFIAMFRQHLISDGKGKNYELNYMESKQVNSSQRISFLTQ